MQPEPRELPLGQRWAFVIVGLLVCFVIVGALMAVMSPSSSPGDSSGSSAAAIPVAPTETAAQWRHEHITTSWSDVRDHTQDNIGAKVDWYCWIKKWIGDDPADPTRTDITCNPSAPFLGSLDEYVVALPPGSDLSSQHQGDEVEVYGTVAGPIQVVNGFGATLNEPEIDAAYIFTSDGSEQLAP